jgi:ribosome maturation factor RimP
MKVELEILNEEIEKITIPLGLKTIEIDAKRGPNGLKIIAVIEKDGGVTISDCEKVTRLLNNRLTILHPEEIDNYTLQVSSPGTERVFKNKKEYELFNTKDVKVILHEPLDSSRDSTVIEGRLAGFKDDVVKIEKEGELILIPLNKISKTKLNG